MFTYTLLAPNREKALDYFINEQLKRWGYFANRIGESDMLLNGDFYIIGNTGADPEKIDNLESGWQIFPSDWGDEDVSYTRGGYGIIAGCCVNYLDRPESIILFEDFMVSPSHQFFKNNPEIEYYAVGDVIEYIILDNTDTDIIWKNVRGISYPNSIALFVNPVDMSGAELRQELPANIVEQIFQNIEAIVWGVYDGDTCAIWVRNGATHVLDVLQQRIDQINQLIAESANPDKG